MQVVGQSSQAEGVRSQPVDEIARVAGVSKGTVYRVLRGSDLVNKRTAKRVQHVIKRMGYAPSIASVGTRRGGEAAPRTALKDRRLGIITLGRMRQHWPSDLMIGSFVSGIASIAREFDVDVMLDDMPVFMEPSRLVDCNRIDGAILLADSSGPLSPDAVRSLEMLAQKLPVVWAMGMHAGPVGIDRVMPDHNGIGHTAAHHLAHQGCRSAAVITATPRWPVTRQRAISFACGADDAGIEVACYLVPQDARDGRAYPGRTVIVPSFHEAVLAMRREGKPLDGLFIPQESDAAHLLPILAQAGPELRSDAHVVYCSIAPSQGRHVNHALAAIHINMEDMARRAIERLNSRMKNKAEPPVVVYVRHRLAVHQPASVTG